MSENGKLPSAYLAPIPGGELRTDAAAAWNAPGGPADAGLRPGGPRSSYRTYDEQVELYAEYQRGGNLAAIPGTSNHGWGVAIDCPNGWEQSWLASHGGEYGWRKIEAFSEPWHWSFVGGVSFPTFKALKRGAKGDRVEHFTRRLAFIHPRGVRHGYLRRAPRRFGWRVERAVKRFQKDHGLGADGVIGPKTAARINGVFHHQFHRRGK